MEGQKPQQEDWNDCVTICKLLYDREGGPLRIEMFKQFDDTEREPPIEMRTLSQLRKVVAHLKGVDPFRAEPAQPRPNATSSRP